MTRHGRVSARRWLLAAVMLGAGPALAQTPTDYQEMRRELKVGADVLRSAFAEALPGARRVVEVNAGYLAGQGVLVLVDLSTSWLSLPDGRINVHPALEQLERIPDLVHDILVELELGLPRQHVEDLKELRDIRDAERMARAEQRALRAERRERRRQLQHATGAAADRIRTEIEVLEGALAEAEAEEQALRRDAGAVRENLTTAAASEPAETGPVELDPTVADVVCRYGATFRSVPAGERLNVLVRQGGKTRYYVFPMERVRDCPDNAGGAAELLDTGFRYDG